MFVLLARCVFQKACWESRARQ